MRSTNRNEVVNGELSDLMCEGKQRKNVHRMDREKNRLNVFRRDAWFNAQWSGTKYQQNKPKRWKTWRKFWKGKSIVPEPAILTSNIFQIFHEITWT